MSLDLAGGLYAAEDGGLGSEDGEVVVFEIACGNLLADSELGDIDIELIRKVLHQTADAHLAHELEELAAGENSACGTLDCDRNVNRDRLVLGYGEEVYVEAVVIYRMELELVGNGCELLAVIESDVYDIRLRNIGDALEIFSVYSEEDVALDARAVKVARNEALLAERLDDGLVASLADGSLQFEVFHCFVV